MANRSHVKEIHVRLDPALTRYWVAAEYDADRASTEEEETCRFLGISEGNQRVLLHRARAKVRGVLEKYLEEE